MRKKLTKRGCQKIKNEIEMVNKKIIISGENYEIYDYEYGYLKGFTLSEVEKDRKGRKIDYVSENYDKHRQQVIHRARTDIKRLVYSNYNQYENITSKFVTLTFAENITDLKIANYEFQKFIKRLNYHIFGEKKALLKYSLTVEFQDRGAIHYHIIFYNLPFIVHKDLAAVWENGFIKINKIENAEQVVAYMCKYLTKSMSDSRLENEKCYFNSRGLNKPIEITDKKQIEAVESSLSAIAKKYEVSYPNDHLGLITYKQYNTSNKKNK